jgi:hypothetical protein
MAEMCMVKSDGLGLALVLLGVLIDMPDEAAF